MAHLRNAGKHHFLSGLAGLLVVVGSSGDASAQTAAARCAKGGDASIAACNEVSQIGKGPCGDGTVTVSVNRSAQPLSANEECSLTPGTVFKECADCPEMVVVPPGRFTMGSPASEEGRDSDEGPQHTVTFTKAFAVGRFHVTVDQFSAFVAATGYKTGAGCYYYTGKWELDSSRSWLNPGFTQQGTYPVVCVNFEDTQAYIAWLSRTTGKSYRLLSESEFEYSARGRRDVGTYSRFWFGNLDGDLCRYGNGADRKLKGTVPGGSGWAIAECDDGHAYTSPVGSYRANEFGLYDMAGNAWQWTQDCYNESYTGAPTDGSAWTAGDCSRRVLRGGSWENDPGGLRTALRYGYATDLRYSLIGFRLGRTLFAGAGATMVVPGAH